MKTCRKKGSFKKIFQEKNNVDDHSSLSDIQGSLFFFFFLINLLTSEAVRVFSITGQAPAPVFGARPI